MKNKKPTKEAAPAAAVRGTPDEFKMIRRAELFPDPDQPRKTFGSLVTLARSIREQGIIQPLIVRFVPAKYKLREPDLHSKEWHVEELLPAEEPGGNGNKSGRETGPIWAHAYQGDEASCRAFAGAQNLVDRFVIVAGERRWRASAAMEVDGERLAELAELPCVVRDVDARRKFAQQWIENNQREGVSAIEEAEALNREFERRKKEEPGLQAEAFARENGMSRADFYGTLVLIRLHKPVREALVAGKISPSLAKVVAQVPEPKQQEKLLQVLTDEESWQYPFSVRDAQEIVDEEYAKNLNDAPFKKASGFPWSKEYPESVKAAVSGIPGAFVVTTCEECPNRSGNMVESFPELAKRPNVCTNVHCFALKCKAHWLRTTESAKAAGKKVMTETEFRKVKGQYVKADDRCNAAGGDWHEPWDKAIGKTKPEGALVATRDGLMTVYPKEEALAAAKKNGYKFRAEDKPETAEDKKKREEKEKRKKERGERREALVSSLIPQLEEAIRKLKGDAAWHAAYLLRKWHSQVNPSFENKYEHDREKDHRVAALGTMFGRHWPLDYENEWMEPGLEAWKVAGIDLVALFEKAEKESQQALTLPAKKEQKQGELLTVKKNKKRGGKR